MITDTAIISQPFGIGDIIFCQTAVKDFVGKGKRIIWPVEPVYAPIAKHFPDIVIVNKNLINVNLSSNEFHFEQGANYIPLRFSDTLCKVPYRLCMQSKYQLLDSDWTKWKNRVSISRDFDNETALFNLLELSGEGYNLISSNFGTGCAHSGYVPLPDNGLRNIEMRSIPGITLIDWLLVMQNATTIHAVASSNIYLFELYDMKAKEIHLYPRKPIELDHRNYSYILTKNYILH